MPRKPSYPGPYVIEIPYSVPVGTLTLSHTHSINCKPVGTPLPGAVPNDILLVTAGGGNKTLQAGVTQYWGFLRLLMSTNAAVSVANFFEVAPESYEKTFITSVALLPTSGTAGTAAAAREDTLTFRSGKGSYMQINVVETPILSDINIPLTPLTTGANYQRMAAYILSADNIATCRDRSFPIGSMKYSNTQNENAYKKRFRQ